MYWFKEPNKLQKFVLNVIKKGKVPRHIAFILDGNRRSAKNLNRPLMNAHLYGFEKVVETLGWCKEIGIKEISLYVFAIENFNRSPEEVERFMSIALEKGRLLYKDLDLLNENGVCVRFCGETDMLPEDLQKLAAEAQLATHQNTTFFLNLHFAYSFRREVAESVNKIKIGVKEKKILESDISEYLLEKCFYSPDSLPVDLLIRTSGEIRLSDYLLWQSSNAILCFVEVNWPEYRFWDFIYCIIFYQRHQGSVVCARNYTREVTSNSNDLDRNNRVTNFLNEMKSIAAAKLLKNRN